MSAERVGVVGAGTMGAGIAQLACLGGYETVVTDPDGEAIRIGMEQVLGQLVERGRFRPHPFGAVFVDEEQRRGVGLVRSDQCLLDVVRADHLLPDVLLERAVVVERLVHDVPFVDLAGVAADHRRDPLLHNGEQARARPRRARVRDPRRQLLAPHEDVTAKVESVVLREPSHRVGL